MGGFEYWEDVPDKIFEQFQHRLELVQLLLNEDVSMQDKRAAKKAYMRLHQVSDRTLRRYVQLYRKKGDRGLLFYRFAASQPCKRLHDPELEKKLIELVHELPSRSVPQLRRLLSADERFSEKIDRISDRTVYRFLQENSLGKKDRIALSALTGRHSYRSFEAAHSLALVQGDARDGIWIPSEDGKPRKTYLFLWIDDYSRKILFGKYYYSEKLSCMEDSFKNAVLRFGIPQKAYLDNGSTYISKHFAYLLSSLKTKKLHHPPFLAHCKGKVESDMKTIKHEFQDEAQLADMRSLDEVNTAFWAWSELSFNKRIHSSTGETPDDRFLEGLPETHRRIEDLSWFLSLFLWRENRKISKYGKIKLHSNQYPVASKPYNTTVQVRFDPVDLAEVYIYDQNDVFLETTRASKQQTLSVGSIPEERKNTTQQISQASKQMFSELRERYLKERTDTNSVDFSRFYTPKEGTPDE